MKKKIYLLFVMAFCGLFVNNNTAQSQTTMPELIIQKGDTTIIKYVIPDIKDMDNVDRQDVIDSLKIAIKKIQNLISDVRFNNDTMIFKYENYDSPSYKYNISIEDEADHTYKAISKVSTTVKDTNIYDKDLLNYVFQQIDTNKYIAENLGHTFYINKKNNAFNKDTAIITTKYIVANGNVPYFQEDINKYENAEQEFNIEMKKLGVDNIYCDKIRNMSIATTTNGALENIVYKALNEKYDEKKKHKNERQTENCKTQKELNVALYFGYGYTNWSKDMFSFSTPNNDYDLHWSSSWDLGFKFTIEPWKKWTASIGLGYQSNIYRFDDGFSLGEFTSLGNDNKSSNKHQKLVARYVVMPLMFHYSLGNEFVVKIGAIPGVNFRTSHTVYKRNYDLGKNHIEESMGTSFKDFNPFKVDAQVSIAYEGIGIYYRQSLTKIFKYNRGEKLYPFTIGLTFGF